MTYKEKVKKLKKLADAMYYAAQHLTTDASMLHKAMDEYHRFIVYEYGIKSKNATGKLKEYIDKAKDKCKGCNNVKGCVTCVDGSERAHIEESTIPEIVDEHYWDMLGDEHKFKAGDVIWKNKDKSTVNRVLSVEADHYVLGSAADLSFDEESQWELVEESEKRYPSFEESQGECHPFQDIALNG